MASIMPETAAEAGTALAVAGPRELVPEICTGRYVEFLPDSAHGCARESGDSMKRRPRRNHTPACKAKVALAAIKGDRTLTQLSDQYDIHVNQITTWKDQLLQGAAGRFGARTKPSVPEVDIRSLHAKIGELTLENDS